MKTHFATRDFTRAEWDLHRPALQRQILTAAGLNPLLPRTPLNLRRIRTVERGEVAIETLLFEPLPGLFIGGNLFRPRISAAAAPAVLIAHGHWKRGRLEDQPVYSVPALGVNLARQGYIAMSYDLIGFNDARQISHSFGGWREELWSFSPMGLQLWTSIRALDVLLGQTSVDPCRVAVTGASGGGTQSFLLAAVDSRIRAAAPVNMVSAHMQGGDPCEEAPGLRIDACNVDFAALCAPRPMLLVSSTRDWTRNTPVQELPAIRRIYALYDRASMVENAHFDAEHNYNRESREAVYRFFGKHLLPPVSPFTFHETPYEPFRDAELLALPSGEAPREAATQDDLLAWWKGAAELQLATPTPPAEAAAAIRAALHVEYPLKVKYSTLNGHVFLSRSNRIDRVPGRYKTGRGVPALVVHPRGSDAAWLTAEAGRLLDENRPVLAIDAFQTGLADTRLVATDKYYLSYNVSPQASRVQDILTALSFLSARHGRDVELIGLDQAGVWCLFAAAIAPLNLELNADLEGVSESDDDLHKHFFTPGIQRAGGLAAALRLTQKFREAGVITDAN